MASHIGRRKFLATLGGAVATWPLAARAQQPMPVIGWLSSRNADTDALVLPAFRQGLSAQGYFEERNIMIEYRWADTQIARMPALAADLVRRDVAVVVVVGDSDSGLQAVRAESTTMPIVGIFSNPVTRGLISSLNRPGGNITGVNVLLNELGSKRLGVLHELLPRAVTIAVLMNPTSPITEQEMTDVQTSARAIGLQIKTLDAANDHDLDAAFAKLARLQPDALLVTTNPLFFTRANQIVTSVAHLEIPAMYFRREFVDAGGLISYGSNADDNFRVAGDYTARILKGAKAGDLPVQQPTKYELIINLKTAKALGLTIPESFLLLADEVIE